MVYYFLKKKWNMDRKVHIGLGYKLLNGPYNPFLTRLLYGPYGPFLTHLHGLYGPLLTWLQVRAIIDSVARRGADGQLLRCFFL